MAPGEWGCTGSRFRCNTSDGGILEEPEANVCVTIVRESFQRIIQYCMHIGRVYIRGGIYIYEVDFVVDVVRPGALPARGYIQDVLAAGGEGSPVWATRIHDEVNGKICRFEVGR